jgi:hypothetical protein
MEFYQHYWDIIKVDMISLLDGFFKGVMDVKRINYGIITLLPKVKEAEKIQQFRPICLLNCLFKWFTKCLTIRLEPVANRIINEARTTFIKGRNIMTSILALHEVKRSKKIGVVFKIDFEKAYDKVHWDFLIQCLVKCGFSETWCAWIRKVMEQGTVAVKMNNTLGPYFMNFETHFHPCYLILLLMCSLEW